MNQSIGEPAVTVVSKLRPAVAAPSLPGTILHLRKPTVIKRDGRYALYNNGIICDFYSALEWFAAPNEDISWVAAASWVKQLGLAGGGWCLPDIEQLRGLHKKNKQQDLFTPLFELNPGDVWSSETLDGSQALGFNFVPGNEFRTFKTVSRRFRAMAVRPRQNYFGALKGFIALESDN